MVHVTVLPFEDGTSPSWSHVKVLVTSSDPFRMVQVSVLSATDGFPPTPSHDRVLEEPGATGHSTGKLYYRLTDGFPPTPSHDRVRDDPYLVSVHVTVLPFENGISPSWSHVKVPVTSSGTSGMVQVSVLSVTDGFPPTPSHDRVRLSVMHPPAPLSTAVPQHWRSGLRKVWHSLLLTS